MVKLSFRVICEYIVTTIVGSALFWAPIWPAAWSHDIFRSDFPLHQLFAEHMRTLGTVTLPHFLYELLMIIGSTLLGISLTWSGALLALLAAACTLTILYSLLRLQLGTVRSLMFAIALALLSPISLFTPHHLYFGYIGLTTYFNPTTILLKPLALLHLILLLTLLSTCKASWKINGSLFALSMVTGVTKPHYLMCLLPALTIYCVLRWKEIRPILGVLGLSIFLPALLILSWQYAFIFVLGSPDYAKTAFLFAPFAGMREHSLRLAPKLLASILLPASLLAYHREEIFKTPRLLLPMLLAVIGLLYSYLLVEAGERGGSMNFIRAGEISLFLLTILASIHHIRYLAQRGWKQDAGALGITILFFLSIGSGILLYLAESLMPGRML